MGSLSIRGLLVLVAVVAANLAFIQFVSCFKWPDLWPQVVPMGLALQVAGFMAWRRREQRRPYVFWAGFLACGGVAWLTLPEWWYMSRWAGGDLFHDVVYGHVAEMVTGAIDRWHGAGWSRTEQLRFNEVYGLTIDTICWTPPLLALGILGGAVAWVGRRLVILTLDRGRRVRAEDSGG